MNKKEFEKICREHKPHLVKEGKMCAFCYARENYLMQDTIDNINKANKLDETNKKVIHRVE